MCGIAGIAMWRPSSGLVETVERMIGPLVHRGPDDQGCWYDEEAGVGLGQRRLSIIDLSPQGHQPMSSASGRYIVAYNGEIYNFAELRSELEATGSAPVWRGHSDTEVLLACVEAFGIGETLKRTVGMFAISLWDRETRTLILARDRLGEKPLYYGEVGGRLFFGSELKALHAVAKGALRINPDALSEFMRFGYVPAPMTIYQGVRKLPPGHWLQLRNPHDALAEPQPYWQLNSDCESLLAQMASADDQTLIDTVEYRLSEAIRLQMVSDVPLGAFLSGGVDSSAVVALMQAQSSRQVRTYTIGFDEVGFNEAPFAMQVARHLGTAHTELYVTARDAEELIPRLPSIYDEPFADSSQIPTTLVSHLTRRHVTVSLSGDGGDELFAGYPRYGLTADLWRRINRLPLSLRRIIAMTLRTPSAQAWDRLLSLLPASFQQSINGRRMHRLGQLLITRSLGEMYLRLMSQWQPEENLVRGTTTQTGFSMRHWDESRRAMEAMRLWDVGQYLPDDLLVKVDRASMSASLEVRAPLLDHRVVELAFALPHHALVRGSIGKWVLRQVLYRHVPPALIERPKTGFAVPLGNWLRGPLHAWADELLCPAALAADGLLDGVKVGRLWKEHNSGSFDRSSYLWNVLMFQAWVRRW